MVFSDAIHAMLMTHDKYRQFTTKQIADTKTTSRKRPLQLQSLANQMSPPSALMAI